MNTAIEFQIDESILVSLKQNKEVFIRELLFNHALKLYRQNKLSLGKAAELAGYDRLDFIQKLQVENEPIFDYDAEMIDDILQGADMALDILNKRKR